MEQSYLEFLQSKIQLAPKNGLRIYKEDVHPVLFNHQKDIVVWALEGGQRAGFLSFGLGKTIIQLEILRQLHMIQGGKYLIVCPLAVQAEFNKDAERLLKIKKPVYITNTGQVDENWLYVTNYERVRKGDIDPSIFNGASFDEASVLRGLSTQTVDVLMKDFKCIPFRFVFTATPAPNKYLELTHYADYLGIMDRGQILTRFFQRDSTTAGNLTLFEKREKEFWYWMSSWACFITDPSDLGYSSEGYEMPDYKIHRHLVSFDRGIIKDNRDDQIKIFANSASSLQAAAKEKRESLPARIEKMADILESDPKNNYLLWHVLNKERDLIEQKLKGKSITSVDGSQSIDVKEKRLTDFADGKVQYLSTKPKIAGSGCNFQHHCHKAIFLSIDYKFNDFIQAFHRIYRFMQKNECEAHIIYTDAEEPILDKLEEKWSRHLKLQSKMTEIIKKHGLNSDLYSGDLKREMFTGRKEHKSENSHIINNDNVAEMPNIKDNSIGLICTSIPFGNHYEYSENYNCFGHNQTNEDFFKQMDYLTPELMRVLMPGRICAVHVKDRIRYSYMTGAGFTSIEPFSDHTNSHFLKHGFHLMGRITITTDVVSENNQTYRLGWSEKCKDGSKMGVGLPEYILLFRKVPTDTSNAYADIKVEHSKDDYTIGRWQIDAHAFWKSDGKRLISTEMLQRMDLSKLLKLWKAKSKGGEYSYQEHIAICDELEKLGKLPRKYMALPPISNNPDVWDDIVRMKTLNTEQSRRNMTKHICPLQLDLVERIIERYSNKGDVVLDPFGGLMSVPYQAVKMGRKGIGIELNSEYYEDGSKHMRAIEYKKSAVLELF